MAFQLFCYTTVVFALCTLMPKTGADFHGLGIHGNSGSSWHTSDHYGHNSAAGGSRMGGNFPTAGAFETANSLQYLTFEKPLIDPRTETFSSSSSSLHGGSSSGTTGSAAAFGTSPAGVAQSSSLQDGTAGATSGSAATHNVYGKNRATGSSIKGGSSSSSGGYGAASGVGYSDYYKGQLGIDAVGAQKGYSGYYSGGEADGLGGIERYAGSNRHEIYGGGYTLEHSGVKGMGGKVLNYGHAGGNVLQDNRDNFGYAGTDTFGNNAINNGYNDKNEFGRHVGSPGYIGSNTLGSHIYGNKGESILEGIMGNYKKNGDNTLGSPHNNYEYNDVRLPPNYAGIFTSDVTNIKGNYLDIQGEDLVGYGGEIRPFYNNDAIFGGGGAYGAFGYNGVSYVKDSENRGNGGHIGSQDIGAFGDINESLAADGTGLVFGGAHYGKPGLAGTANSLSSGFGGEQWGNINVPAIIGGGDSNEGLGTQIGANTFDKFHIIHAGKGAGLSEGSGEYSKFLIGSSSSSGHGGSSSATSGYGAALAASAEGRVHSSSSDDGASEATSGLAAAMSMHGKNKAFGSSSEKGTSTGTGGMAAANALGGIKARSGVFGSSSSSSHGGSSTGTSGFGSAIGASKFGGAHSSSLYDGTSGATSGLGATQSLYGSNRASGSSVIGGTSSSTGGYGAASGVGYGVGPGSTGGNKGKEFGSTLPYRHSYGGHHVIMGRCFEGGNGAPHRNSRYPRSYDSYRYNYGGTGAIG